LKKRNWNNGLNCQIPERYSQIYIKFILVVKGIQKLFLFLFIILSFSCGKEDRENPGLSSSPPANTKYILDALSKLFAENRSFEMRDLLKTPGVDYNNHYIVFYRAFNKCVFGETDSSIILFDKFLSSAQKNEHKGNIITSYSYQAFNYANKLKWEKSAQLLDEFLTRYPEALPKNERNIILNVRNSYIFDSRALTSIQKKSSGFEMKLIERDPKRIAVSILLNGIEGDFILDTGAEINSIPEKNVKKFGIKEFNDTIYTSSSRGRRGGRSGIANNLAFGNLEVTNATFLIYPDKEMPIYSFDGIIGYPTLRHLGKIMIDFKDLKISSTAKELNLSNQNLCYSGKGPVISARRGETKLCFAFDTGAYWTLLHSTKYTNRGQFQLETVVDSSRNFNKYRRAPEMNFEVGKKKFEIKNVTFLSSSLSSHTSGLDGIFGVQALQNYNRIYIDFTNLIIEFE